ncbi:MAG TPA: hypothetical protein VFC68_02610, partial [Treponemataceae bacterium]|nr:hypothetical protein [Treponemataceae bacterium]
EKNTANANEIISHFSEIPKECVRKLVIVMSPVRNKGIHRDCTSIFIFSILCNSYTASIANIQIPI